MELTTSGAQKRLKAFLRTAYRDGIAVLTRPAEFFEARRGATGYRQALLHALAVSGASGLVVSLYELLGVRPTLRLPMVWPFLAALILGPLSALLFGVLIQAVLRFLHGAGTTTDSVAAVSYAMSALPIAGALSPIPLFSLVAWSYGIYLLGRGVLTLHRTVPRKTWISLSLSALLAFFLFSARLGPVPGPGVASAGASAGGRTRTRESARPPVHTVYTYYNWGADMVNIQQQLFSVPMPAP